MRVRDENYPSVKAIRVVFHCVVTFMKNTIHKLYIIHRKSSILKAKPSVHWFYIALSLFSGKQGKLSANNETFVYVDTLGWWEQQAPAQWRVPRVYRGKGTAAE